MVKRDGVFYMKSAQERELEKRVKDRKRELMESFRAQKEERMQSSNTETRKSFDRGEEYSSSFERRRTEEREGPVSVSQRSNGLHSTPAAPERNSYSDLYEDKALKRTPSFKLNAGKCQQNWILDSFFYNISCKKKQKRRKMNVNTQLELTYCFWSVDGALLSQMSPDKSSPKVVTTCESHHLVLCHLAIEQPTGII